VDAIRELSPIVITDASIQFFRYASMATRDHSSLSTQGAGVVNARDRIGRGPWYNPQGVLMADNVTDLHTDNNKLGKATSLTEKGAVVNGLGDRPNQHDALTGSPPDGTAFADGLDRTCSNYTSNAGTGAVQVGHADKPSGQGGNNHSWNSAHATGDAVRRTWPPYGGAGLLYCFAVN
jgi:hypothetical protein